METISPLSILNLQLIGTNFSLLLFLGKRTNVIDLDDIGSFGILQLVFKGIDVNLQSGTGYSLLLQPSGTGYGLLLFLSKRTNVVDLGDIGSFGSCNWSSRVSM